MVSFFRIDCPRLMRNVAWQSRSVHNYLVSRMNISRIARSLKFSNSLWIYRAFVKNPINIWEILQHQTTSKCWAAKDLHENSGISERRVFRFADLLCHGNSFARRDLGAANSRIGTESNVNVMCYVDTNRRYGGLIIHSAHPVPRIKTWSIGKSAAWLLHYNVISVQPARSMLY